MVNSDNRDAPQRGTSLITAVTDHGIVMAADDLVYSEKDGQAIPGPQRLQKVFVFAQNILIGTAGVGVFPEGEYEADNWIIEFIQSQTAKECFHRPSDVAAALLTKASTSFDVIHSALANHTWHFHKPGEWVVSYIVAGYAESFKRPYLFELGAEVNTNGDGLIYPAPI